MGNYVDFFRYSDKWEDVFVERNDDGTVVYLYVCAEPHNWAYMLSAREYRPLIGYYGERTGWLPCEHTSASANYLQTLEPAPDEIARELIWLETRDRIQWENETKGLTPDDDDYMDPDEWADYLTETMTFEEC